MRKILCIVLLAGYMSVQAQSNANRQPIMFVKAGAGFGNNLGALPTPLVQEGMRKYYSQLRDGFNGQFQLGFYLSSKNALSLLYNHLATNSTAEVLPNTWEGEERFNFVGLVYQHYVPVGVKRDINFVAKAGPGAIIYRRTHRVIGRNSTSTNDASRNALGFYTAAGTDFKITNMLRFEVTLDGNWGRVNNQGVVKDADMLSINGGFILQIR